MSKQAFIELVTADQPEAPPYFVYDAVLNSKERLTLDEALERELKPRTLDQLLAMQAEGAQILETRDPDEFGAAHLAGSINIAGYLQNGLRSLEARPDLVAFTERLSVQFAAELLSSSNPPLAIDVRGPRERAQKHIENSVSMPLNHLAENLNSLPTARPLLVYCAGGYRSSIAAGLLKRGGFASVGELAGGIAAWEAAKLAVSDVEA